MTPVVARRLSRAYLVLAAGIFVAMVVVRGRLDQNVLAFGLPIVAFLVTWALYTRDSLPGWLDRAFAPAAALAGAGLTAALVAVGGMNLHTLGYAFMFCLPVVVMGWLHWSERQSRPVEALPPLLRKALQSDPETHALLQQRELISEREARAMLRATSSRARPR